MSDLAAPAACPVCAGPLRVEKLRCGGCETAVEGRFVTPPLAALDPAQRAFAEAFLLAGGNLKALGDSLGVSYPTLRGRLDELIATLRAVKGLPAARPAPSPPRAARPPSRQSAGAGEARDPLGRKERILAMIESGEISAAEGKARLRGDKIK